MARLSSIAHNCRVIELQQVSTLSAFELIFRTRRLRKNWDTVQSGHEFSTRSTLSLNVASVGASSQRHTLENVPLVFRRSTKRTASDTSIAAIDHRNPARVVCTAGAARHVDKYGHCKCIEDAMTSIMKNAIQHCLHKENDVMRDKVVDQIGRGLAALCRVSVGVAAESSTAPIPIASIVPELSTIKDEDLEQVRRLLQLTSLPFHGLDDHDLQRLTNMLQKNGDGQYDTGRTLSGSELSEICERLGSDMFQCLGPLVMCFPELPLWAKHRALLLPAEVAGRVALSLLTGPSPR